MSAANRRAATASAMVAADGAGVAAVAAVAASRVNRARALRNSPTRRIPEHAIAHEDHEAGAPEQVGLDEQQPRQGAPAEGEGGEVRRRRRRGRRGGRRNRQERNGEAPFQSSGGEGEPGLQHAVQDLDRPPASYDRAPAMERPIIDRPYNEPPASPPEERPAPPPAAAPAQAEREPPRRRSTIREPAPIAATGAPPAPTLPPPTPVISSTASEDSGQPKRGWWAKKFLGDKG